MKALINFGIACMAGALALTACGPSRVVVRDRPVVVRPAPPYPGAVWITEEYAGRPGHYRYIAPHYVRPRAARAWVPGHWNNGPRGQQWNKGYWR